VEKLLQFTPLADEDIRVLEARVRVRALKGGVDILGRSDAIERFIVTHGLACRYASCRTAGDRS